MIELGLASATLTELSLAEALGVYCREGYSQQYLLQLLPGRPAPESRA